MRRLDLDICPCSIDGKGLLSARTKIHLLGQLCPWQQHHNHQSHVLEDGKFPSIRICKTCHLQGHGSGDCGVAAKDKVVPKDGSSSWQKADPCHLWNKGKCPNQASSCKYRHICELCHATHHKGS